MGSPDITSEPTYLADLPEFDVKAGPWPFTKKGTGKDGKIPIAIAGVASPKGLGMAPPNRSYAAVKYRLDGKAILFKVRVALNDSVDRSLAPAVFEVLGDGKSLWKSNPISQSKKPQECMVNVVGVEVLELRVHAQGSHFNVHAVWAEPRLLPEKGKKNP